MIHGIQGLLQEKYVDLSEHIKNNLDIELLKRTPSAHLIAFPGWILQRRIRWTPQ